MSPLNELAVIRARLEERAARRQDDYHGTIAKIDIAKPSMTMPSPRSRFPEFREKELEPYEPPSANEVDYNTCRSRCNHGGYCASLAFHCHRKEKWAASRID